MCIPKSYAFLNTFAWMASFFASVGDDQPTSGEIHLDPESTRTIYNEYNVLMVDKGQEFLQYPHFMTLWCTCFAHVKIREYEDVSGKCDVCAAFSAMRGRHLDDATRRHVSELHALHRTMYMGERLHYYSRRNDAFLMPALYASLLADGMQRTHCLLPLLGNMINFAPHLPQHLQGIISHGRNIQMYRTFHNVRGGANGAIHCFLLALETIVAKEGRCPDVLYYQVDGGSENAAKTVLGIAELIVSRGLCKKLVVTRLPVGHTHEDIDSKFAFIWKRIRNCFVLTPLQYKVAIEQILSSEWIKCTVVDLFVVPVYVKFITPFMDNSFGRYAKSVGENDWTHLQWTFEAVPSSIFFSLGVKVTYRKYAADEVILIREDAAGLGGFKVVDMDVVIYPGFYLLNSLPPPGSVLLPDAFVLGGRVLLDSVFAKITKMFHISSPHIVAGWASFASSALRTDDAQEYCLARPLVIPLNDFLFGNAVNDGARAVHAIAPRVRDRIIAGDSVTFRRRGRQPAATAPYNGVETVVLVLGAATTGTLANTTTTATRGHKDRAP